MKNNKQLRLGEGSINRLMMHFSLPCIFSLLIGSLYNIVDQIFIGNSELSTLGNAATGVVFPVFIIAQAIAWCFGDGCAAYLNICQGQNNDQDAQNAVGGSITVSFLLSLILIAVIFPIKAPMLLLFGASENTLAYATTYLNIILITLPLFVLSNALNSVIRADGSPTWAMAAILIGALTNTILDPLFIFGFKMGMAGAAIATAIGQGASFLTTVVYFFKPKTFKLSLYSFVPKWRSLQCILRLGISTFITQGAIVLVAVLSNVRFARLGACSVYGADVPIAVIGIQSKLCTIVLNLTVGLALGCQPIISYNTGAGNYKRVRELFQKIMLLTLAIGLFFTALFELFPREIIGLFGLPANIPNPNEYWIFGEKTLRIFLSLISITCIVKTASLFFQAVGKPIFAVISSTIRDVIAFIPLILILPLFRADVEVLLYAAPISDVIAIAVTAALSISFLRSLKREEEEMLSHIG